MDGNIYNLFDEDHNQLTHIEEHGAEFYGQYVVVYEQSSAIKTLGGKFGVNGVVRLIFSVSSGV